MASLNYSECQICCEPYNKSSNKRIDCIKPDCKFKCCLSCFKRFTLENTTNPHCMDCKTILTPQFIVNNINKTFYNGDFKKNLKEKLWDMEQSRMPETMNLLSGTIKKRKAEQELKSLKNEEYKLKHQLHMLAYQKRRIENRIFRFDRGNMDAFEPNNGGAAAEQKNDDKEQKVFIMPCRNNNCNGYLNKKYKCEICECFTCSKCLEFIGNSDDKETHECKEENIESAKMIRSETKPCPKCGTRIFKIDGCDQMWCTECKVAFSWKKGTIETGVVHNPHYYQWLKTTKNSDTRNPLDQICGGLQDYNRIRNQIQNAYSNCFNTLHIEWINKNNSINDLYTNISILCNTIFNNVVYINPRYRYLNRTNVPTNNIYVLFNKIKNNTKIDYNSILYDKVHIPEDEYYLNIADIHQSLYHIINVEIPAIVNNLERLQDNSHIRVKYMLKDINKDELLKQVTRKDTDYKVQQEILLLYQVIRNYGIDMYNELVPFINNFTSCLDVVLKNCSHFNDNNYRPKLSKYKSKDDVANNEILVLNKMITEKIIPFWNNKMIESYNLIKYINNEMRKISITYNRSVPVIIKGFRINSNYKYKVKLTNEEKTSIII